MHIVYPYNEILPKKKAHDIYIFNNCLSLAKAGCSVDLLCGAGSLDNESLATYYHADNLHGLQLRRLPILRKNNPLNISWNAIFFFFSQRFIKKTKPDIVITSVRNQGRFHFNRKIPGTRYVYEIHELAWYPNQSLAEYEKKGAPEAAFLKKADLIVVSTEALKEILQAPPYGLTNQIVVIPLAVQTTPLPPPKKPTDTLSLMYVGQLYEGQGIPRLLQAIARVPGIHLEIIGGKEKEIQLLKKQSSELGITNRTVFHGFHPPSELPSLIAKAHAFIAPFEKTTRMPYVAHTKLFEYASWGRPLIAPNLPVVTEHFPEGKGALLFEAGSLDALVECLEKLKNDSVRERLQREISLFATAFSWEKRTSHYKALLEELV